MLPHLSLFYGQFRSDFGRQGEILGRVLSNWQPQKHANEKEQAFYAVCWLNLLPGNEASVVKALPGGNAVAGKTSDYCK